MLAARRNTSLSEDVPHPWHLKTCKRIPLGFTTRRGNWTRWAVRGPDFWSPDNGPALPALDSRAGPLNRTVYSQSFRLYEMNSLIWPDALLALQLSSRLMSTWPRINTGERGCKTVTAVFGWVGVKCLTDEIEDKGNVEFFWLQINRAGVWGICTVLFTQATWEQWGPPQSSHW